MNSRRPEKVSVIFSTYNSVNWLEKTLWGFANQTFRNFEIIIADDGSNDTTRNKIDEIKNEFDLDIIHVWQPDEGFQKSRILNKAIVHANTEYLVFTDGDCIPRKDFLEVHVKFAEPGCFLSGGYFKLPIETSELIDREDVFKGNAFDKTWLLNNGLPFTYKLLKLTAGGWVEHTLNKFTPASATWNGHNSSGWKKDIVAVNGFDERMQYGGQDRELGERLMNKGIKGKQIRYSAVCLHLDHPRGYKTKASIDKNLQIRSATKREKRDWTEYGIEKSEQTET